MKNTVTLLALVIGANLGIVFYWIAQLLQLWRG